MLTDEQRAKRRHGLGGSDAPAVFDVGFSCAFALWVDKLWGNTITPTARMQRGSDLEPLIAAKAAEKLGFRDVTLASEMTADGWVDHPDLDWMFANLDAICDGGEVIIECKAIEYRDKGHEWGHDGDPEGCSLPVNLQALHQLETTGAELVVVSVLFVDTWELRTFPIRPDRDIQGRMVDGEHRFWFDNVVAQVPPPIADTDTAWDAIRQIDEQPASKIVLPDTARTLIADYVTTRDQRLKITDREKKLRVEIARLMGDNTEGVLDDEIAVEFKQPSTGRGSRRLTIPTPYRKENITDGNETRSVASA